MHWAVNETARIQATMLNMQLNHEFFFFSAVEANFFSCCSVRSFSLFVLSLRVFRLRVVWNRR